MLTNASKEDLQANWQHVHEIILPDINLSTDEFQIVRRGDDVRILSPLSIVEGAGPAIMEELIKKRPFKDLRDFLTRIDRSTIHRGIIFKLILSGTLNSSFRPILKITKRCRSI